MPIDFESLKIGSGDDEIFAKKELNACPLEKPGKQTFFRVRPGAEYSFQTACLNWSEDRTPYILEKSLWPSYEDNLQTLVLRLAVNRQNEPFFFPCPQAGRDGKMNKWHISRMDVANRAETKWVRMSANTRLGRYDVYVAQAELPEPEWPDVSFQELLNLCFRDSYIETHDHPVLKALRGA